MAAAEIGSARARRSRTGSGPSSRADLQDPLVADGVAMVDGGRGPARYCVLDVETALSDLSAGLLPAGDQPTIARVALHELVVATTLTFDADADGGFRHFRLTTVGADGSDEPTMLERLDAVLRSEHDEGAALVTFNGSHDLSVLRRRAARHWLFSAFAMEGWPTRPGGRHLDLMRLDAAGEGGRWPSLVDACAGFGINAVCEVPGRRSRLLHGPSRKNQVDVVATALLLFHHLAIRAGSAEPLARGWAALARHLRAEHRDAEHLRQFREHPYARVAARLEARFANG